MRFIDDFMHNFVRFYTTVLYIVLISANRLPATGRLLPTHDKIHGRGGTILPPLWMTCKPQTAGAEVLASSSHQLGLTRRGRCFCLSRV